MFRSSHGLPRWKLVLRTWWSAAPLAPERHVAQQSRAPRFRSFQWQLVFGWAHAVPDRCRRSPQSVLRSPWMCASKCSGGDDGDCYVVTIAARATTARLRASAGDCASCPITRATRTPTRTPARELCSWCNSSTTLPHQCYGGLHRAQPSSSCGAHQRTVCVAPPLKL